MITPILAVLLAAPPSTIVPAAIFAALGFGANVVGVLVGCLLNPDLT